jgi:hypothetical protein
MSLMSPAAVAAWSSRKGASTELAVYRVIAENGAWRIDFRGVRCGCFSTLDEALSTARKLARECAALGRPACVQHDDAAGGAAHEWHLIRRRPLERPAGRA